jgi:hypothetical protein
VSALETQAQVDPRVARFYTFFTDVLVRLGEFDLTEVCALGHVGSLTIAD